ncbi:MAG: tRNA (adenosine(37)-N6)-threonylcarbamoyltransferase complex ATPase subunit type 1 TsaE [Clostridia bacterium]|nr:tRNA (adenosine(37)-N6)-threonylcarbamoyltransferase complex ATPase subunit type 1 TsaE [Clostridia bacterium]
MKQIFYSSSVDETEDLAKEFAKKLLTGKPEFVAMYGDLGVGKTAFVRGLASVLAPNAKIKSPTYTIVNQHKGESLPLYHLDVYRISDDEELYSIGFDDYVQNGICVVEWSENIPYSIPKNAFRVTIERTEKDVNSRKITIEEAE